MRSHVNLRKGLGILGIVLVILGAWFLRVQRLDEFKLTDETKWAFRSANFSLALHRGEYDETFQRSHPGVTTMWAGWLGIKVAMPDYVQNATTYVENTSYKTDLEQNDAEIMEILVPARYVVISISMLIVLICFLYIEQLFGFPVAALGTILLAFEPFFIGHTRILHVDGFLSVFMYLSLIAFLAFLKNGRIVDLLVSSIAAGLTWLTKTPGFYLAAGIIAVAAVSWIFRFAQNDSPGFWKSLWNSGWPLMLWVGVGITTFILLWPAMWVRPAAIIRQLLLESLDYAVGGHSSPVVFNGVIYRDGIVPRSIWQYYPVTYLWRVSPLAIVGLLFSMLAFFFKREPLKGRFNRVAFLGLIVFALGFMLFMSAGSKRSDRYVLPVFPALSIAAGMGWAALVMYLWDSSRQRFAKAAAAVLFGLVIMGQMLLSALHLPYFLTYFNPLMGGARKAPEVLQIGWGEGLDEAARYLNAVTGAEDLTVASWYERVFSEFFVGRTINIEDQATISAGEIQSILDADFIVIYYHQVQRAMPENLLKILEDEVPALRMWFNGLEYIRIYDTDTFSASGS